MKPPLCKQILKVDIKLNLIYSEALTQIDFYIYNYLSREKQVHRCGNWLFYSSFKANKLFDVAIRFYSAVNTGWCKKHNLNVKKLFDLVEVLEVTISWLLATNFTTMLFFLVTYFIPPCQHNNRLYLLLGQPHLKVLNFAPPYVVVELDYVEVIKHLTYQITSK